MAEQGGIRRAKAAGRVAGSVNPSTRSLMGCGKPPSAMTVRRTAEWWSGGRRRAEYHALLASPPLGPSSSVRLQSSIGQRVLPGLAVAIALIGEVAVL